MRKRRRFACCLMASRLPLLIIWTLILALLLYSMLDFSTIKPAENEEQPFSTSGPHEKIPDAPTLGGRQSESQLLIRDPGDVIESGESYSSRHVKASHPHISSSTTRKSPSSEYSRQSEIFILIIEGTDQRSRRVGRHQRQSLYPSAISSSTIHSKLRTGSNDAPRKITFPKHIKILMEILDYHRIAYTIGTTRYGLPEQLLVEANNSGDKRRYSVIIVDDFIKYTNLNRWMRDQLDRFCVSNKIGVITYLLDNHMLDGQIDSTTSRVPMTTSVRTPTNSSTGGHRWSAASSQFPLAYESMEHECQVNSTASCLVDYQISDRTNILRILKSKKNFVIRDDLSEISDQRSLIVMSSNHITYEPLTWVSFAEPPSYSTSGNRRDIREFQRSKRRKELTDVRGQRRQLQQSGERLQKPPAITNMVTQYTDRLLDDLATSGRRHAQKRAVLPSPSGVTQQWFRGEGDDDDHMHSPTEEVPDEFSGMAHAQGRASEGTVSSDGDQSSDLQLEDDVSKRRALSMVDRGLYDGIRRVIFGVSNRHWANRILLLDAIEHLSSGEIMMPLDRYVQIDIDDIFVGEPGTRLNQSDVETLVETQRRFASYFDADFKFNLGFSGKYFKRGNEAEQAGDESLIEQAQKFTWFCHFWSHSKPHLMDRHSLTRELERNLEFAREKNLTLIGHQPNQNYEAARLPPTYAVAPHHSGVYPIHDDLYDTWRRVLNVQVTSTEEYPHLRPASGRRGFVYKHIRVLPRQVCGLYTHTIYKWKYPGGFGRLMASIRGGELFETLLHNPVNIYMTHMSNYANDRLAPYTFDELFKFVREHTNLRLRYASSAQPATLGAQPVIDGEASQQLGPLQLANYYFDLYPAEREPFWTNPCQDKRHLAIWAPSKHQNCQVAPNILIVGPQKAGTTALISFLKLNPLFKTSRPSADDFEEVQFFNDKHYLRGVDWYLERFLTSAVSDALTNSTKGATPAGPAELEAGSSASAERLYYVDKSATYFDDPKVAQRASSLLPRAIVLILLIDPADRAYSWYQHMRAHGDLIASELTFDEILFGAPSRRRRRHDGAATSAKLDLARRKQLTQALRSRCLHPGYYSSHLSNWLQHFDSRQIVIIDGEWFKYNPVAVLDRLQALLRVPEPADYSRLLVYDEQKAFFCERPTKPTHQLNAMPRANHEPGRNRNKCLGSGKGRKYEQMSASARMWLNKHYLEHNRQLAKLLYEIGQPLPRWLDQSLSPLPLTAV